MQSSLEEDVWIDGLGFKLIPKHVMFHVYRILCKFSVHTTNICIVCQYKLYIEV